MLWGQEHACDLSLDGTLQKELLEAGSGEREIAELCRHVDIGGQPCRAIK